jgi:hypothetical protein
MPNLPSRDGVVIWRCSFLLAQLLDQPTDGAVQQQLAGLLPRLAGLCQDAALGHELSGREIASQLGLGSTASSTTPSTSAAVLEAHA